MESSPNEAWGQLKGIILRVAEKTLGPAKRTTAKNRTYDPNIQKMSEEQRNLRLKINNTQNEDSRKKLKTARNKILHNIAKHVLELRNTELDNKAEEINQAQDSARMFKALKELEHKQYENPKVYDEHQKFLMNPNDILDAITRHFQNKFFAEEKEIITAFPGEPKPVRKPISISEVTAALKKLNNNRAAGKDNIPGELLKYGANCISPTIAKIFNNALENHELDINTGLLLSLQKPGKEKGPLKNLTPITLLNTIRKTL